VPGIGEPLDQAPRRPKYRKQVRTPPFTSRPTSVSCARLTGCAGFCCSDGDSSLLLAIKQGKRDISLAVLNSYTTQTTSATPSEASPSTPVKATPPVAKVAWRGNNLASA